MASPRSPDAAQISAPELLKVVSNLAQQVGKLQVSVNRQKKQIKKVKK
jgi:hypothetical protein